MIPLDSGERLADDPFGAIALGGIEKINAKIQRLRNQVDCVTFRSSVPAHAEPAGSAAAKTGNAHF
jgi:hypothetical protein